MKMNDAGKAGGDDTGKKVGKGTGDADLDKKRGKAGESDDDDSDDDKGQGGDKGAGDEKPKGKFMTDEDVNAIVQKRLARERKADEDKAELTKTELLEKERDDARSEVRISNARDSFITGSKLEYGKASKLFRVYKDDLEFDDAGKVTNMADVLKSAKDEWPEFFKPSKKGDGDLGEGNGDRGKATGGGMNDIIRRGRNRS